MEYLEMNWYIYRDTFRLHTYTQTSHGLLLFINNNNADIYYSRLYNIIYIHQSLLRDGMQGRMEGRRTRGSRRVEMIDDLREGNSYETLKRKAPDRVG